MPLPCAITISVRLRLPDTISTTTSAKPIGDLVARPSAPRPACAPRKAYFEFEAQPAMMTP
jgi:hypothetical protein